jgi:hypothetical protein
MTKRTDWRKTCAELIENVRYLIDCVDRDCFDPVCLMECREHLSQTRAALAQPEPEGVTERIASIATAVRECAFGWEPTARLIGNVCAEDVADLCGAILTRYAHPTTEPVPVSEPVPGREDCNDEGEVWVEEGGIKEQYFDEYEWIPHAWVLREYSTSDELRRAHWYPHNALPVPGAEVG